MVWKGKLINEESLKLAFNKIELNRNPPSINLSIDSFEIYIKCSRGKGATSIWISCSFLEKPSKEILFSL